MSAETTYSAYLEAVGRDLEVAARRQARMLRRRRARLRLAAIAVASIVLLAGSALAGAGILGGRAPDFVQTNLASLWQDDGSRLAPTDGEFRAVAIFGGDTLIARPGLTAPACAVGLAPTRASATRQNLRCFDPMPRRWPSAVNTVVRGDRQAIFGQIRAPDDASLVLQWPGAVPVPIPLSLDGYFLIEVPLLPCAHRRGSGGRHLRILAADGGVIDSRDVLGQTFPPQSDH